MYVYLFILQIYDGDSAIGVPKILTENGIYSENSLSFIEFEPKDIHNCKIFIRIQKVVMKICN